MVNDRTERADRQNIPTFQRVEHANMQSPGLHWFACWCGREDSNFHGLSPTTTSTLRVYQFRHDRTREKAALAGAALGRARPLAKPIHAGNGHTPVPDSVHFGTMVNSALTIVAVSRYDALCLALLSCWRPLHRLPHRPPRRQPIGVQNFDPAAAQPPMPQSASGLFPESGSVKGSFRARPGQLAERPSWPTRTDSCDQQNYLNFNSLTG